jgi:hypothetical protein
MADDLAALLAGATRPDNSAPPPGLPTPLYYIPREWWRGEGGGPSYLRPPSGIKSGTAPFSPPSFPLGTRYPPPPPPGAQGIPGGGSIKRRPLPYNMQQMLDEMPDAKLKDEYQQGRAV